MDTRFYPNPCIFEEVSVVPAGVPPPFSKRPPTIFRKHMPSGMGTDILGTIGYIFAENGPLEGGVESSFSSTGWAAKGDFIRYSYMYPYIFESRTHTANIHPIVPKLSVPIPEGMCFLKMVGGPLRKCTDRGQKSI